jgi:hypothetical protein
MAVRNAALGQIVGGEFQRDAISGQHSNSVAAEFARKVSQYGTILVQLNAELSSRKLFYDGTSDFDAIFFTHFPRKMRVLEPLER